MQSRIKLFDENFKKANRYGSKPFKHINFKRVLQSNNNVQNLGQRVLQENLLKNYKEFAEILFLWSEFESGYN